MKRFLFLCIILAIGISSCKKSHHVARPKIVIGLVIDQMRWDYLYRYYDKYSNNGFKRLLDKGFVCQNTLVNYIPSFTAPGHTCIYTGSVPSIHGIAGNNWIENQTGKGKYCTDDPNVYLVGDEKKSPSMSPANLLTTTITDELRLATNQKSRVFGIAIKDRGGIIPAGHLANAAFWYNEKNGNFTTSSYYPIQHPEWLQNFNKHKYGDSLTKLGWLLLKSAQEYDQSTTDATNYEKGFKGEKAPVFPHVFDTLPDSNRYSILKSIPAGNTFTFMMAKACLEGENLGKGDDADFLAISLSSTDYAAHQFGPNSVEMEDMFLRLDIDIALFLNYLDKHYGKENYLLFVTADHGGAHNAEYLTDLDIPAGTTNANTPSELNAFLKKEFKYDSLTLGLINYQVYLDYQRINKVKLDKEKIKSSIIKWLKNQPGVAYVIDMEDIDKTLVPEPIRSMTINGYNKNRSGEIQIILNPGWMDNGGRTTGTTHGSWNPYDTHIPLIWYGWHIQKGETNAPVNMTDITPTLAALLHIQMPNGCIGKPIEGVVK